MTTEAASGARWRSRIVRQADVAPEEIEAHPLNFRSHPPHQAAALAAVLDTVGYVQTVIVNERTGRLLDGHLRVRLAVERAEPSVPVAFVDLDEAEERLILATFDPLGSMAETSGATLALLLESVATPPDALGAMLDGLRASVTPTVPTPRDQAEPTLASECLIEIRCSAEDRDDFSDTLAEWSMRDGVEIHIS